MKALIGILLLFGLTFGEFVNSFGDLGYQSINPANFGAKRDNEPSSRFQRFNMINQRKVYNLNAEMGVEKRAINDHYNEFIFLSARTVEIKSLLSNTNTTYTSTNEGPAPRVGHSATFYQGSYYIFGGMNQDGVYYDDMWRATLSEAGKTVTWNVVLYRSNPVPERAFHSAVLHDDAIYVFGGEDSSENLLKDGWKFDLDSRSWSPYFNSTQFSPQARAGHAGFVWSDDAMYIWGGLGNRGLLQDMWRFDFMLSEWRQVNQVRPLPARRYMFQYIVTDTGFMIVGGLLKEQVPGQDYWSPQTGFLDLPSNNDNAGDVWTYSFTNRVWTWNRCIYTTGASTPEECRTSAAYVCPNQCNGNGICIADGQCACFGDWTGTSCSINTCAIDLPSGVSDLSQLDRILASEALFSVARRLTILKEKLQFIKERLPSFEDLNNCKRFESSISQLVLAQTSQDGLNFHQECMAGTLIPVLNEFDDVLDETNPDPRQLCPSSP